MTINKNCEKILQETCAIITKINKYCSNTISTIQAEKKKYLILLQNLSNPKLQHELTEEIKILHENILSSVPQ